MNQEHDDGWGAEMRMRADRDYYKARAEELLAALEGLANEWYGLWVGSHEKFSPPEIAHAKRVEYQARALITRINQEDSERA